MDPSVISKEDSSKKKQFPRIKKGDFGNSMKGEAEDDDQSLPEYEEPMDREGDIFVDLIDKVLSIEKRKKSKYFVEVEFVDKRLGRKWVDRDFIRVVAPK